MYKGFILNILLLILAIGCGEKKQTSVGPLQISFSATDIPVDTTPTQPQDSEAYIQGTKLIATQWGQGHPYNQLLPKLPGRTTLAGCLPIALAQMINYHRPRFIFQKTFYHRIHEREGVLRYDNYQWDYMNNPQDEIQEKIGLIHKQRLIRDIGHTVQASYRNDLLGTSSNMQNKISLLKNFGLRMNSEVRSTNVGEDFNIDQNFIETIKSQIDLKLPVLLTLTDGIDQTYQNVNGEDILESSRPISHMAIIDGYKIEDDNILFHINWGWNGLYDGLYSLQQAIHIQVSDDTRREIRFRRLDIDYAFRPCQDEQPCSSLARSSDAAYTQSVQRPHIDLDQSLPLAVPSSSRHVFHIPLKSTIAGKQYRLALENSESNLIQLWHDNLIVLPSQGQHNSTHFSLVLYETNSRGEDIKVDQKNYRLLRSNRHLSQVSQTQWPTGNLMNTNEEFFVYLKGTCDIFAERGYDNPGFYYNITPQDNQRIHLMRSIEPLLWESVTRAADIDVNTKMIFEPGIYKLTARLNNSSDDAYYNLSDLPEYSIRFNCDENITPPAEVINRFYQTATN